MLLANSRNKQVRKEEQRVRNELFAKGSIPGDFSVLKRGLPLFRSEKSSPKLRIPDRFRAHLDFRKQQNARKAGARVALENNSLSYRLNGGGRGIRTPGTLSGTTVFKTVCFNRSHIPPREVRTIVYQQFLCGASQGQTRARSKTLEIAAQAIRGSSAFHEL